MKTKPKRKRKVKVKLMPLYAVAYIEVHRGDNGEWYNKVNMKFSSEVTPNAAVGDVLRDTIPSNGQYRKFLISDIMCLPLPHYA